jgi:hypothetical protein
MAENDLISLKEAAKISGYSPDYIGQLIRAGKIPGRQVYSNIAWMTTSKAVEDYKNKGKDKDQNSVRQRITNRRRKLMMEFNIIRLFFQAFKTAIPLFIIIIISLVVLTGFLFYQIVKPAEVDILPIVVPDTEEEMTF